MQADLHHDTSGAVFRKGGASSPNIVEDQPLTVVEGDAHVPVEPADLVAVHLKAWALGLDNVDGLLSCKTQTTFKIDIYLCFLSTHLQCAVYCTEAGPGHGCRDNPHVVQRHF